MTETCASCKFKHQTPYKDEAGEAGVNHWCRRYPPTLLPSGIQSNYPPIPVDAWCGEYQKEQKRRTTTKAPSSAS